MFLIDNPYVSDFLINTIKDNNYEVIATTVAKELIKDESLNWISEEEAIIAITNDPGLSLYSNSENALSWIEKNLGDSKLNSQINQLKDKVKFRTLTKNIFPDFYYKKIRLEAIQELPVRNLSFPFVIKPSIGFFSIGVHIINNEEDWQTAKHELTQENLKSIFPETVLNTAHFIIEEYIQGEEYAIDYYHDENGEVVLLNVLHHLFSSGTDTSDRVYTTSKDIIHQHKTEIEHFLNQVGRQLELKNFPAHAEVRIDKNGKIVPIEINPLRFGGWCTTGDLLGITLGFNSYKHFIENKKPDWETLFRGKKDKTYGLVILDNNSGINPANIEKFRFDDLAKDFENPVLIRKLDINKYPVFGFVFTESSSANEKELSNILTSDLKEYLTYSV